MPKILRVETSDRALAPSLSVQFGGLTVLVAPPVTADHWTHRVVVSSKQAVVAFQKLHTVGIGFQHEDKDWNTNLPYLCDAEKIYAHIRVNSRGATRSTCIRAIRMLQAEIAKTREEEPAVLAAHTKRTTRRKA